MVQDPNFWRRFSVAVHNDEAAAPENGTGTKETKHAYVVSLSSPPDSPASTPTSHCHLSPALPAAAFTRPLSAPAPAFAAEKQSAAHRSRAKSTYNDAMPHGKPVLLALHTLTSTPAPIRASLPSTPRSAHFAPPPQTPTPPRPSRRTSRIRAALSSPPPSPLLSPPPKHASRLSLGISLSGRPRSSFRFWTTISADGARRESWLAGQTRKARQRAWMCWAFWGVFVLLVVGAVVAVLVLQGRGII